MTPELPPGWPGYLFGLAMLLFPFLVNWKKGKVDESAMILGRWKDMVDQHAEDIKELRDELRNERAENARLRSSLADAHEEIGRLKDEVVGLKRMIAQNSQSTAQMLGDPAAAAILTAGKKKRGDHTQ